MEISAVIVTFNRKLMLKRCLLAVCEQTYPVTSIFVVDNNSTDGTDDFLSKFKLNIKKDVRLVYHRMCENLGGAGGFEFGVTVASNEGADFIWLMDDDGFPSPNCLEELLKNISDNCLTGPMVVSQENKTLLSFPLRIKGSFLTIETVNKFKSDFPHIADDILFPFNGTLIPKEIVKNIGAPRGDYFIWGDEIEYTLRCEKAGYQKKTVTNAIFYHPKKQSVGTRMMWGILTYNYSPQALKNYCIVRNSVRNYLDYKNPLYAILFIMKTLWFYTFTKPCLTDLKIVFHAFADAFRRDFTKHKKYLSQGR